jgi:hemolysin III
MASISQPIKYDFPNQSIREEIANTISHGLGFFASVVGAATLLMAAGRGTDTLMMTGLMAYALSLVAVYALSTLSHAIQEARWKHFFRVLDQAAIYLLIAGTYTPFILLYAAADRRWPLLFIVWGVALIGLISKVVLRLRVNSVDIVNYALLGWLPALALYNGIPSACLWWMFAGGVSYTVGTIFLTFDQRVPFFHTTWHACVIAGSAFHYFAIMQFTLHGSIGFA